jgi:hypothetical protein
MKLRQLFEALGDEVAIIFGRFNPPHKGHRAAWELASKSPVWIVGTNRSTVGPKDPLPYDVKVEAMKTIWPEVEGHIVPETSWLTLASEVYKKYPKSTLLCLTDEDWVTKTIQQYNGKEGAHGYYNFEKIEQKPTPRLSSATALRDAVVKGDRDAFSNAAGVDADTLVAGKPFFDLVAEYLMPYQNAPKKTAKKKVAEPVESFQYPADPEKAAKQTQTLKTPISISDSDVKTVVYQNYTIKYKPDAAEVYYGDKLVFKKSGDYSNPSKAKHSQIKARINSLVSRKMQGLPEDAAGVGIVTKQNTTKDVNKHTLNKMLKAFHLIDSMSKELDEAPIEMDPEDPMNPMIVGAGSNPAKLKYRMLRAANQLKDLAQRAQNASAGEWVTIGKHFEELSMNIQQIRHGLDELAKLRKKGGIRSRGIDPNLESTDIPFDQCPQCRGPIFHESLMNEKQDACYHKVKSRYKVWPSAYASGALVQCRKKGAKNWGNKSK